MGSQLKSVLKIARQVNPGAYVNSCLTLAEGMLGATRPFSLPQSVDIVLTKACNLRCTFCISYGSVTGQRWMPWELYRQVARKLFPTAFRVFFCSGGEPLMYAYMREALRLARAHRTVTNLTSNGMLLDRRTSDWLVADQSLHELYISFDGARPDTVERIRRGASYDTILENLDYLTALKKRSRASHPRVWLQFVIMRSNAKELPELFNLCTRYGVDRVKVKYLHVANDIDAHESLLHDPGLARRVFKEARMRARESGTGLVLPPLPDQDRRPAHCLKPWQFCQIDTDGSVRFCYSAWRQRLGFFDDGFESIWHGATYRAIRRTVNTDTPHFPYCRYCSVRHGFSRPSSHDQRLNAEAYVIPGLEDLQVPFNQRPEESFSAFRSRTDADRAVRPSLLRDHAE